MHCGCPAGTHRCDLVSRLRLDQSANIVVVWLGLVSHVREVIMETWNVRKSQHNCKTKENWINKKCIIGKMKKKRRCKNRKKEKKENHGRMTNKNEKMKTRKKEKNEKQKKTNKI